MSQVIYDNYYAIYYVYLVQIEIVGVRGRSFTSDIAIDHIEMTPGTCDNPSKFWIQSIESGRF